MANAFRKVGNFLGLVDDEEMYEATVALPETRRPRAVSPIATDAEVADKVSVSSPAFTAADDGATERTPSPNAATATSAMRLKVVFVDILFLSVVVMKTFSMAALR